MGPNLSIAGSSRRRPLRRLPGTKTAACRVLRCLLHRLLYRRYTTFLRCAYLAKLCPERSRPMIQGLTNVGAAAGAVMAPLAIGALRSKIHGGWRNFFWMQLVCGGYQLWAFSLDINLLSVHSFRLIDRLIRTRIANAHHRPGCPGGLWPLGMERHIDGLFAP